MPTDVLHATHLRRPQPATAHLELTLDPGPRRPRIARRSVGELLRRKGAVDELVNTAALLVSEVVTNAGARASNVVRVRCEAGPRGARVEVLDDLAGEWSDDRRGDLDLVDAMATEHGVRRSGSGTVVWFVVGDPV